LGSEHEAFDDNVVEEEDTIKDPTEILAYPLPPQPPAGEALVADGGDEQVGSEAGTDEGGGDEVFQFPSAR
jgi:hypothetical protein